MAIAIKAENLSKAYQLGEFSTGTISRDIERWWLKARGKEDPFLKIGETNDRTVKGSSDIVWSLKDINFEINQGEAVGIIGRNGAGKSTLLKVLSRVTTPTTGGIKVKGRIASLLEVGTGFHPELTGKENIFLNGAILGMRKAEIRKHFDAIVGFSGVERYIDTPVKRYSSGMYVRLAFAVAAHLESEILIVDEVLAVGDAEFQKKCLGKMGEVSKGEGRTVLFVSHNMSSIKSLCNKGILLQNGELSFNGIVEEAVGMYLKNFNNSSKVLFHIKGNQAIEITDILINDTHEASINIYENISINIKYKCNDGNIERAEFFILIYDEENNEVVSLFQKDSENFTTIKNNSENEITAQFINILKPGDYRVGAGIFDVFRNFIDWVAPQSSFRVESIFHQGGEYDQRLGKVYINAHWK